MRRCPNTLERWKGEWGRRRGHCLLSEKGAVESENQRKGKTCNGVKKEGGQAGESVPGPRSVCYDPEAGRSFVFSGSWMEAVWSSPWAREGGHEVRLKSSKLLVWMLAQWEAVQPFKHFEKVILAVKGRVYQWGATAKLSRPTKGLFQASKRLAALDWGGGSRDMCKGQKHQSLLMDENENEEEKDQDIGGDLSVSFWLEQLKINGRWCLLLRCWRP